MEAGLILSLAMRWIHLGSAVAAGAPFFVRFALLPAARTVLDEASRHKLQDAINRRWRKLVYVLITLLILSGSYNFLVAAPWKNLPPDARRTYHMFFGVKILAAFVIFFLASALAGRTAGLAPVRKNARQWLGVLLLALAVVIICGGILRSMHNAVGGIGP